MKPFGICAAATCALAAPLAPAEAGAGCGNWNTELFFVSAAPSDVIRCLNAGADPDARAMVSGDTSLHLVTEHASVESISALIGNHRNLRDQWT